MMAAPDAIRIISFNMRGFNQGRAAIEELITKEKPDVFLIQEHWLTPSNLSKFDDVFTDYFTFGCSAMSKTVEMGMLKGRPFGGVMIMIRNNLHTVSETVLCCDRYVIVRIADCIIVNVYLPCAGSDNRLTVSEEILREVWTWCDRFAHCNLIIAGDFNAQLNKPDSDSVFKYINAFIKGNHLHRCDILFNKKNISTYENLALNNKHSTIDYFLTSSDDIVSNFDVLDPDINFSDHNPIALTCQISVDKRAADFFDKNHDKNVVYPRWDHADLTSFYHYTGLWLEPAVSSLDTLLNQLQNGKFVQIKMPLMTYTFI